MTLNQSFDKTIYNSSCIHYNRLEMNCQCCERLCNRIDREPTWWDSKNIAEENPYMETSNQYGL